MPLVSKLKQKMRKAAAAAGTSILNSIADAVVEHPSPMTHYQPEYHPRARRDWTTAGTMEGHRIHDGPDGSASLMLLDRQLVRRMELLVSELSKLISEAESPILRRSSAPAPPCQRGVFDEDQRRVVILVHQSALVALMEMRTRVGPIAFDCSDIGSNVFEHILETYELDLASLALAYSKIEQFEGFGVTTYGQPVRLQNVWYDITGVITVCMSRIMHWEEIEQDFGAAVSKYLDSIQSHVQATPLIAHDYNVLGPFCSAEQYNTWRSSCSEFASFVRSASTVQQSDIFAVSYKHSMYEGLFRWSPEADLQIAGFIEERGREGRSTYLWFDQLLKTQQIDRRDWVMAGLMPYRKFSTVRVCQVGARHIGNHMQPYCCECSKSMWMDIEFAVAASTGRYFMLDGACVPNVDSNLNAYAENTSLPSYIEVAMCAVKGANDGLLMPAMILFSSAAHNYACRRVYSESDVREAQEFACASLLPHTMGRRGNYYLTEKEMESVIHLALRVASETLSSGELDANPVTSFIESFPPVSGGKIDPFGFLPGLAVHIQDGHGFPSKVQAFGTTEFPGQFWGFHVGSAKRLAYASLICDGEAERVICRVVGEADPGTYIKAQTETITKSAGIQNVIDYYFSMQKATRTW